MIICVYLLNFLLISLMAHRKLGNWINIISVFSGLWTFCGVLSTMGLYEMRKPSIEIHLLALLFVITTELTMLFTVKRKEKTNVENSCSELFENKNGLGAAIMQIVAIGLGSTLLLQSINVLISTGSFSEIRGSFYSNEYEGAYFFNLFCRQVPIAMMDGLIIYYLFASVYFKKTRYLGYAAMNVVIASIINGGRQQIILFILAGFVTTMLAIQDKQTITSKWGRKYLKMIGGLFVLVFCIGVYITLTARSGGIVKGLLTYSVGSFSFLDLIFKMKSQFGLDERLYGYLTFGFFTEPLIMAFKVLGFSSAKTPSWFFNIHCQPFYNISAGQTDLYFNNNTSVLYFLYYDFGWLGMILGGVFLGYIVSKSYNKYKEKSLFFGVLFVYLSVVLMLTIMYYRLSSVSTMFVFFTLFVCSRKFRLTLSHK